MKHLWKIADCFVIGMTVLSVGSAIAYFLTGDWKRGLYWSCVSIINTLSIFLS